MSIDRHWQTTGKSPTFLLMFGKNVSSAATFFLPMKENALWQTELQIQSADIDFCSKKFTRRRRRSGHILQKRGKIILENVGGSVVGSNQTVAAFDT
jgi:hypothetical protein